MKNFKLVTPNATHETAAIDMIHEYVIDHASVCGTSGLASYLDNYQGWLEKLEAEKRREADEYGVPNETFFFVGSEPDGPERIIGICSVNYVLNSKLWANQSHLSYSIRPSERGHGYARYMLYAMVCHCSRCGMEMIMLSCDEQNTAAIRAIRAVGGKLIAAYREPGRDQRVQKFVVNARGVANDFRANYEPFYAKEFRGSLRAI